MAVEIAALPENRMKSELFAELVKTKCQADLEGAWSWAKAQTDPFHRHQAIELVAERLADNNPEKLLALFDEVGWEYASRSPQDITFERRPDGSTGVGTDALPSRAVRDAIRQQAEQDPRGALRRLVGIPRIGYVHPETSRNGWYDLISHIGRTWMKQSPQDMLAWMANHPEPRDLDSLAREIVREADIDARTGIVDYLLKHPDDAAADEWGKQAIAGQAVEDPQRALAWTQQLDAAGVFADSAGDGAASDAYHVIAGEWMKQDSLAASEWIASLEPGPRRDAAATSLISVLLQSDHPNWDGAFAWAQSLVTESKRVEWLEITINAWKRKDAEAAMQALESAGLPATLKAGLQSGGQP